MIVAGILLSEERFVCRQTLLNQCVNSRFVKANGGDRSKRLSVFRSESASLLLTLRTATLRIDCVPRIANLTLRCKRSVRPAPGKRERGSNGIYQVAHARRHV